MEDIEIPKTTVKSIIYKTTCKCGMALEYHGIPAPLNAKCSQCLKKDSKK
jgi:hypothetical protein